MPVTVLIGAQWGDEGKGKIIDVLAEHADVVARFQGGNDAGHTVIVEGKKYVLHLIPSGVHSKTTTCTIGNGVIINTSASIDHDCTVGDFTHISPGVHVAGGVKIGQYSWLGIGCSIVEYIELATNTKVGAGAVVHKSTVSNQLYVGVPASPIKSLTPIQ